jgi:tetraacyldisaccharide 4'-kinase
LIVAANPLERSASIMSADAFFQKIWYGRSLRWLAALLLPLSWLFAILASLRQFAYRSGILRSHRVARPVIIVGNITVGGTGKTPFTIWLANELSKMGSRVGIVLRGYGGRAEALPLVVSSNVSWQQTGDEAQVLRQRTQAIVVVDPDRVRAARKAIETGAQIILSDDGLQHLQLARDYEIAVLDAARGVGNARMLPAGPLRESVRRLRSVNACVWMQRDAAPAIRDTSGLPAAISARAVLGNALSLLTSESRQLADFAGQRVHAVAGIGNPSAFFSMLRQHGLEVIEHPFPDHAVLNRDDVVFADSAPVLMTHKDAVRCQSFADERMWAVHMEVEVEPQQAERLLRDIKDLIASHPRNPHSSK